MQLQGSHQIHHCDLLSLSLGWGFQLCIYVADQHVYIIRVPSRPLTPMTPSSSSFNHQAFPTLPHYFSQSWTPGSRTLQHIPTLALRRRLRSTSFQGQHQKTTFGQPLDRGAPKHRPDPHSRKIRLKTLPKTLDMTIVYLSLMTPMSGIVRAPSSTRSVAMCTSVASDIMHTMRVNTPTPTMRPSNAARKSSIGCQPCSVTANSSLLPSRRHWKMVDRSLTWALVPGYGPCNVSNWWFTQPLKICLLTPNRQWLKTTRTQSSQALTYHPSSPDLFQKTCASTSTTSKTSGWTPRTSTITSICALHYTPSKIGSRLCNV